jgi:hypothetical protein
LRRAITPSLREPLAGRRNGSKPNPPTRNEQMNALKRWNRLKDLEACQHGLDSLLGRRPGHGPEGQEEPMAVAHQANQWKITP